MNLLIPVFVRRDPGGQYEVSTIGPPGHARAGRILEDVKARLALDVEKSIRAAAVGTVWTWLARPRPRLHRHQMQMSIKKPGGGKTWVSGRWSFVVYDAPAALGGAVAWVPRVPELFVHVRPGEDPADRVKQALKAVFAGDPGGAKRVAIDGAESIHRLELVLDGTVLIDRRRARRRDGTGMLAGGPSSRRRKRGKDELGRAETLLEVGVDLTARAREGRLDGAHGRDPTVDEIDALLRAGDVRAVLLVGEPGTGKTAIVEELARRVAARQAGQRLTGAIFSLSADRIIAGMRYVGQWEERVLDLLDEADHLGVTLHADSLPELIAAGRGRHDRTGVAQLMKPAIADGRVAIVAETTPDGLRRSQEEDRSLVELFRIVHVREPDPTTTLSVALRTVRAIELRRPGVVIDPAAVGTALDLLGRFVPYEAFPGKAVRLLRRLAETGEAREIGPDEVLERFARIHGLARRLLEDGEAIHLDAAAERIATRVRGQPEAVGALVDVVATLKAGLKDPDKPLAVMLFVGPTGVGKTESAKALAEYLFGSEERLLRFDLNEYGDADAATRLVGAAHAPEGELTRAIRERPFAVVLLDEVEKAHPAVLDVLLQLLGEGRITDALGRTADARNAVFILTSNLGADRADRELGFGADAQVARYERAVEEFFRPELVNRFDRVVAFGPLPPPVLREIAAREVGALLQREGMTRRRFFVEASDALLDDLVARGTSARYGARPLRREVERRLAAPLAAVLAASPEAPCAVVSVGLGADGRADVSLEPLVGLGPCKPGPRPGESDGVARPGTVTRVAALAERMAALEASEERAAVQRALLAVLQESDDAPDAASIERLQAVEEELHAVRGAVDELLARLDGEGFVEHRGQKVRLKRNKPTFDNRSPLERSSLKWVGRAEHPQLLPALRAATGRLGRIEHRVRTAFAEPDRVLLRLRAIGSELFATRLSALYDQLARREGMGVRRLRFADGGWHEAAPTRPELDLVARRWTLELTAPGLWDWLRPEQGVHELQWGRELVGRVGLCAVEVLRLSDARSWDAARAAPDARLGTVVRKYIEGAWVHDVPTGASVPVSEGSLFTCFDDAFAEVLLARLASGAPAAVEKD